MEGFPNINIVTGLIKVPLGCDFWVRLNEGKASSHEQISDSFLGECKNVEEMVK